MKRRAAPHNPAVESIYKELIDPHTTCVVLTGAPGSGKASMAEQVRNYADEQRASGGAFAGGTWTREIQEQDTFLYLASELLDFLGKPDLHLAQRPPQEMAALLFEAMAAPNQPVLIILKRLEAFLDERSGMVRQECLEMREWLNRLSRSPSSCRVLLTSTLLPAGQGSFLKEHASQGMSVTEGFALFRRKGIVGSERDMHQALQRWNGHALAIILLANLLDVEHASLSELLHGSAYQHIWNGRAVRKLAERIFPRLSNEQRVLMRALSVHRQPVEEEMLRETFHALLGNSTLEQIRTVVNSLLELLLVEEVEPGKYVLHPFLRHYVYDTWNDQLARRQAHVKVAFWYEGQPAHYQNVQEMHVSIEAAWHRCQAQQHERAFTLLTSRDIFLQLEQWQAHEMLFKVCAMFPLSAWQPQAETEAFFCTLLARIYERLEAYQDVRQFLQRAKVLYQTRLADATQKVAVLLALGTLCRRLGDLDDAEANCRLAIETLETLQGPNHLSARISACTLLGEILAAKRDFAQAEDWYNQAYNHLLQSPLQAPQALADILSKLGEVLSEQKKKENALACFDDASKQYARAADRRSEATMKNRQAALFSDLGRYDEAWRAYEQAHRLALGLQDSVLMARSAQGAGEVALAQMDTGEAYQRAQEALRLYPASAEIDVAETLNLLGRIRDVESAQVEGTAKQEKREQAISYYQQALAIFRAQGERRREGWTLSNLGVVYGKQQEKAQAITAFEGALKAHREASDRDAESMTLLQLGLLYSKAGEQEADEQERATCFAQALFYFQQTFLLHDQRKEWGDAVQPLRHMGVLRINRNSQDATALAFFDYAYELGQQSAYDPGYLNRIQSEVHWIEQNHPDFRPGIQATGKSAREIVYGELTT